MSVWFASGAWEVLLKVEGKGKFISDTAAEPAIPDDMADEE